MSNTGILQSNQGFIAPLCDRAQKQIDNILHSHAQLFLGDQDEDTTTSPLNAVELDTLLSDTGKAIAPEECYVRIMERRPKARLLPSTGPQSNGNLVQTTEALRQQAERFGVVLFKAGLRAGTYIVEQYVRFADWIEATEALVEKRVQAVRNANTSQSLRTSTPIFAYQTIAPEHAQVPAQQPTPLGTPQHQQHSPTQQAYVYRHPAPAGTLYNAPKLEEYTPATIPDVAAPKERPAVRGAWAYALLSLKRDLLGK